MNINITETDYQKIEGYVAKTLGKGFEISVGKLFIFQSSLNRNQEEEDKKTYFCSELVARLYKELGLLDEEKASTRYFPVDFSDKTKMLFKRDNVTFDHERVLAFNH